jgi:uncharacterized protein YdhG (YjbR/CyaY superfamily)
MKKKFKTVDEYILSFPADVREKLGKIRETIKKAAPDSEEIISYQIPAFRQNRILVWFGAFKNHIGFFPTSKAIQKFSKDLSSFKSTKGTIHFPFDKKIPFGLITKITKYRLKQATKRK